MWLGQRVGVVVPAFNEAEFIAATLARVPAFVDRIYVIDDASSDGTSRVTLDVASPRLVRIRHAVNRGVGAAIVSGYEQALRENLDIAVVMAGDGQMAASDLEGLLAALSAADYVKGNRFLHASREAMPVLRRTGSRFLSFLTRLTTGLDVDDCQCGYTALRMDFARRLPLSELWPRYGYPNDLLALLAGYGARVAEVPVAAVYGAERSGLHAGHVFSISFRILRRFWHLHPAAEPLHGLIKGR